VIAQMGMGLGGVIGGVKVYIFAALTTVVFLLLALHL